MINYIVLGHKNPSQIKRLIATLKTKESFFYIHIDRNANIDDIKEETAGFDNLYFLENERRYAGTWGDLGIVKATIEALKQIISDKRSGYCVLLSGQDYPLTEKLQIESFFEESNGTNYISVFPLPTEQWLNSRERISFYKINKSTKRGDYVLLPSVFQREFYTAKTFRCIRELLFVGKISFLVKLFQRRKFPNYLKPYGGDQWWALPIETIKKIIDFIDRHPDYLHYHKYSLLPDEMFFQSIFMSFNKEKNILPYKPSVTYANWIRKNVALPVTFTKDDFEELSSLPTDKLFARKFDTEIDEEILFLLDYKRGEKND